jgi:NAD(P)-dependent dehydrogenase (short-subunit alcohol dehydrogenase family)
MAGTTEDNGHPFANQVVVITGGGTGIGRVTALTFAKQGASTVIITGRRRDRLEETAALHPAIVAVPADVTTEDGADAVARTVAEHGGVLDVLVHNAGIHFIAPVQEIDPAAARELFDINVMGAVVLTPKLLPLMRSPGGNIVFVTSPAGHNPTPQVSVYAASKAALSSLTRTWALELAPKGIRVNAVAPGWVRTEVFESSGMTPEQVDGFFAQVAHGVPLGMTGVPEDVTLWITRFVDPASAYVTGQIISMDGGAEMVRGKQV